MRWERTIVVFILVPAVILLAADRFILSRIRTRTGHSARRR